VDAPSACHQLRCGFPAAAIQSVVAAGRSRRLHLYRCDDRKRLRGFLLGVPAASSLAFGNADKYFRQSFTNAFVTDDWRIKAALTLSIGVRWEYESPITELYGRLVNLNIGPGFATATPVVAGSPSESLVKTDKAGIQPRCRHCLEASCGIVIDCPRRLRTLSRTIRLSRAGRPDGAAVAPVEESQRAELCIESVHSRHGFQGVPGITATTFAIDPNYRVGTAQNWNLSIQQDLPQSMQMTITYLGIKGTHVPQRILPNTFPVGGVNSCVGCPTGFVYLMSGGNSNRHAGTIEVRRRQRNGFQASVQYTYAKAIDDAGLGGNNIAQDWRERRNERALSNFDQRHQGKRPGAIHNGHADERRRFLGRLERNAFEGMDDHRAGDSRQRLTADADHSGAHAGHRHHGKLRPDLTGAPIYLDSAGGFSESSGIRVTGNGPLGQCRRNSITGPGQFGFNATVARTFRLNERVSMDVRVDSTNVLNHVTFPTWNTTVNSSQFGLPTRANAMRTLQPSVRVRF
jgi:hypothetical protein